MTGPGAPVDSDSQPAPEASPDPETGSTGRGRTLGRVLASAFVVGTFVFWVWAFTPWARRENPDRIDDRGFVAAADALCADLQAFIAGVPTARAAATPRERADQVALGTREVQRLIADLREAAAGLEAVTGLNGPPDAELTAAWLTDWDTYAADRWAHVERLREADTATGDEDFRFLLSDVAGRGVYTERINGFARLNNMDNCQVPGDV